MTCDETLPQLSAYRDEELDPALRDQVQTHLAGCSRCRAQLAGFSRIAGMLHDSAKPPLPDDLRSRIVTAAESHRPPSRSHLALYARMSAAAAGFALFLFGYGGASQLLNKSGLRVPADSGHLEQALHETRIALAGNMPSDESLLLFEHQPETHLLNEIFEDLQP